MASRRLSRTGQDEDENDNYSEDFISDDEPAKSTPARRSPAVRGRHRGRGRGTGRGTGRGKGGGRNSHQTLTGTDPIAQRLLSASKQKVNELHNEIDELKKQLKLMEDENKLFKRLHHKQERALEKFEDQESNLPQLIQAYNNEVRTLKEQLRRSREKYEKTDRYLRDAEDELERATAKLKKYKSLAEEKDLEERSNLAQRVNKAEIDIEERNSKIKELEKHIENLKKNHRHELGIERARSKDLQHRLEEVEENEKKMETQLREKEKELEMKNIYSNRFLKPSSYSGTPMGSPPLWRQAAKKRSPSLTELSNARHKAKAYEERRKEESEKKRQIKLPKIQKKPRGNPEQERKQKWEEEDREKDASPSASNTKALPHQDSETEFWKRQEEEYKRRDQENREKQQQEEKVKRRQDEEDKDLEDLRHQRIKMKQEAEELKREEQKKKQAEEKERKEKEERNRREREEGDRRERKERAEREQREAERRERDLKARDEEEKRAKEEHERKAREEREKLENDPRLAEERRKKDELLRRLQLLDANRDGSHTNSDPFAPSYSDKDKPRQGGGDSFADPFAVPSSHSASKGKKDSIFWGRTDSNDSVPSSKKDYSFTRSIENMHHGKPAQDNVTVPYIDRQRRIKATQENQELGGYQPSFTSTQDLKQQKKSSLFDTASEQKSPAKSSVNTDKKSKLMEDLFGSSASPNNKLKHDESEDFFLTNKKTQRQQHNKPTATGLLWDDDAPSSKTTGTTKRESSTLFGGGAALVDDDSSHGNSSNLLPRRQRQSATTFTSKPAVSAVDNLDDDIEEVIL